MEFDWNDMDRRRNHFADAARKSQPGLPREHLVPGAIVTVSPNLVTGDRSWIEYVFEVTARNEGHVVLKQRSGFVPSYSGDTRVMPIHEHEFYGAEHLLEHAPPLEYAKDKREAGIVSIVSDTAA